MQSNSLFHVKHSLESKKKGYFYYLGGLVKGVYEMGKALSEELFCLWTGLAMQNSSHFDAK